MPLVISRTPLDFLITSQCTENDAQASTLAWTLPSGSTQTLWKLMAAGPRRLILNAEKSCVYSARFWSTSDFSAERPAPPSHVVEKLWRTSLVDTFDCENSVRKSWPMSRISFCES